MTMPANTHRPPANIIGPIEINAAPVSNSGAARRCSIDERRAQLSLAFPQVRRGAGEPRTGAKDSPAGRKNASECTHRVLFSGVNNGPCTTRCSK